MQPAKLKYLLIRGLLFLFSTAFCFAPQYASGQYGLGFAGQEAVSDHRTGLDLAAGTEFCLKEGFELSFDLSFIPNRRDYFGYVVRIIEGDDNNVDLLYDRRNIADHHFKITKGGEYSGIAFDIDSAQLFNDWTRISIAFDAPSGSIRVECDGLRYEEHIAISKKGCFRILFGLNDFRHFSTTDVPAMKIRDVKINQKTRLAHHWPLNEGSGESARDVVGGRDASVVNPLWLGKLHSEWQLLQTITLGGQVTSAFDPESETVFFVGSDSLYSYSRPEALGRFDRYLSGTFHPSNGSQSYFDQVSKRVLNICIDQQKVAAFDAENLTWSDDFQYPAHGTNYLHFNKFYYSPDSSFYFLGGYGHFSYKNTVQRFHLTKKTWDSVAVEGDFFTPRYLSALGTTPQGAYVIGGYGSQSGQQMLNPKNLYDLLYFDAKSKTFTRRHEIDAGDEEFVFANSLVIDQPADRFYGLVFPKTKYNAELQLVSGSLSQPTLTKLGTTIPYLFHDIRSFADLYYCSASKMLLAVVLQYDVHADRTTAALYEIGSPPMPLHLASSSLQASGGPFSGYYLFIIAAFLLVVAGVLIRKRMLAPKKKAVTLPDLSPTHAIPQTEPTKKAETKLERPAPQSYRNSIFLFGGDLQLFDSDGKDITRSFTPLIKELFLVLLLHTIRWGRGISSEKLTELFWMDKSVESARNNRSVNIAKINAILEKLGGSKVSKDTGYWRIDLNPASYVDYVDYLEIVHNRSKLDKQQVTRLSGIVERGGFLTHTDYEWLDPFKAEISTQVINTYLHFAETIRITDDPEFMIELANYIFYFDPVHEEAMGIKCKALACMGSHALATQTFENFCQEYRRTYGEDFGKDFKKTVLMP